MPQYIVETSSAKWHSRSRWFNMATNSGVFFYYEEELRSNDDE